jgi:hypothetical protein
MAAPTPPPTWIAGRPRTMLATLALVAAAALTACSSSTQGEGEPRPAPEAPAGTPGAAEPAAAQSKPSRSVVPGLRGQSRTKAEKQLVAAGLAVLEVRQVPSAQPRGTVLGQSRRAGASVLAGSGVILTVAAPYPRVPDVVGRSEAAAVSRLREAGFKVTVDIESRTSGKDGVVLRQTPAGSSRAKPHATIAIVVSSVIRTVVPPPPPPQNCTSGYSPCLTPASDYDCAGGSGNGPAYASGPIYVTGSDPYDLDSDGDGVACES